MSSLHKEQRTDPIEAKIYALICSHEGIKARDIGTTLGKPKQIINHFLYGSPYMKEMCYKDKDNRWHGYIRQGVPHRGLEDYCGYYSGVPEFLKTDQEDFLEKLKAGCRQIGRSLNDTRGLFHSFEDTYYTMQSLFGDLADHGYRQTDWMDWEIAFELRIKRSRHIRIYADVLLITGSKVFSLEFKMKDETMDADIRQAAKYSEYIEVIFGSSYDVISALVLTKEEDTLSEADLGTTTAVVPVCSGDRLYELLEKYMGVTE